MSENKIKLSILGISFSQVQPGAYALIFAEENGIRRLPIVIGTPEAQSIAIVLENIPPPRPLTHDLIKTILDQFSIQLVEIFIYKFENGAFHSELLFKQGEKEIRIDSRTSDAVAIALRTGTPIYTTNEIMQSQAVVFDENKSSDVTDPSSETENPTYDTDRPYPPSLEELQDSLQRAIEEEDYEQATRIRDEIAQREKDKNKNG